MCKIKVSRLFRINLIKKEFFTYQNFFVFTLLLLFVLNSCDSARKPKNFKEGVIEYQISYLDSLPPKYDPSLRPDKMIIKYKENCTMNRIEGLSGRVSFTFIQNYSNQTITSLIKLMNKKLYYQESINPGQYPAAYSEMPRIQVEELNETEQFMGYTCFKALATFQDSSASSFEVLYTKEICIENPNQNTPFESIDGVMLKFGAKLFEQNMRISAVSIKPGKVSKDDFLIPQDYESVTKETIYDVIYLMK